MNKVGRDFFPIIAEGHTPANTGGIVDLAPDFKVEKSELKFAVNVLPAAGSPASVAFTFGGAFAVGDKVVLTLQASADDPLPQKWNKTYTHIVVAGATALADIVAAFKAKIDADTDAPYSAVDASPVLTVTSNTDDKQALQSTSYSDSVAGTVADVLTPAVISEGQPQDLIDRGIDPADINLAAYDTVKIVYEPQNPIGSIDAVVGRAREIFWYGTPGQGVLLATLINT